MTPTLSTTPEHLDELTRRELGLGTLALVALLAGCASEEPATTAEAGAGYPRTVTDASGASVVIPRRPERVACAQNVWDLDAVLALGEVPVLFGVRDFSQYLGSPTATWPWHERVLAEAEQPQRVSVGDSLDVEAIAASRPDVVIGDEALSETRDQLERFAPVVQVAAFDWRRNLRIVGEVLDLASEAEALISQTDQRLANALARYDVAAPRVAMLATYDETAFYLFGDDSIPAVDLFRRAGFDLLDELTAAATPDEPRIEYSAENLDVLEPAEVLVVFNYGVGGESPPLLDSRLFTRLPAAQADRVVVLPQGEVAQGLSVFGPLNLELGLDLVARTAALVE